MLTISIITVLAAIIGAVSATIGAVFAWKHYSLSLNKDSYFKNRDQKVDQKIQEEAFIYVGMNDKMVNEITSKLNESGYKCNWHRETETYKKINEGWEYVRVPDEGIDKMMKVNDPRSDLILMKLKK